MKVCPGCSTLKPLDQYYKSNPSRCVDCHRAYMRARYDAKISGRPMPRMPGAKPQYAPLDGPDGRPFVLAQECKRCGAHLPRTEFAVAHTGNLKLVCKGCHKDARLINAATTLLERELFSECAMHNALGRFCANPPDGTSTESYAIAQRYRSLARAKQHSQTMALIDSVIAVGAILGYSVAQQPKPLIQQPNAGTWEPDPTDADAPTVPTLEKPDWA